MLFMEQSEKKNTFTDNIINDRTLHQMLIRPQFDTNDHCMKTSLLWLEMSYKRSLPRTDTVKRLIRSTTVTVST